MKNSSIMDRSSPVDLSVSRQGKTILIITTRSNQVSHLQKLNEYPVMPDNQCHGPNSTKCDQDPQHCHYACFLIPIFEIL